MASNLWPEPDLKSCKSRRGTWDDGLDQLPDEVLLSIMSCLTMKEAARTSALSRRWRQLWSCFPGTFNFEDPKTVLERSSLSDQAFFGQDTVNFVTWVTGVVDQHRGPAVEAFKVSFDLSNTYQSLIDKWVVFALTKGAKSLVLDFNPTYRIASTMYALPLKCCDLLKPPYNLPSWKPALKTLFLKHVSVATDILDCFLQSCPFLENLYIDGPACLTSITASGSPLALKSLDVYGCPDLERIEIIAPKLVTFRYRGRCIQLDIQNASLLSEVTVGGAVQDPIAYAFDSLSQYFSQLKYFNVMTRLYVKGPAIFGADLPMNMVIPPVSNLMNLEHLKLTIFARPYQTLVGWITLIEACPVLQKLTLELICHNMYSLELDGMAEERSNARPLGCLKTLELCGFVGRRIDLEFATHVIANAVALEQVVVDFRMIPCSRIVNPGLDLSKARAMALGEILPPGAKLVVNE